MSDGTPRQGLRQWLERLSPRAAFARLARESSTPAELGRGVALGVFFACSPFYGFQVLLGMLVAGLLRLNKLAVFAGLQVSGPPLTPFFIWGQLQAGRLLTRGELLPLSWDALTHEQPSNLAVDFVLGSFAVGIVLAGVSGLATRLVFERVRARRDAAARAGSGPA